MAVQMLFFLFQSIFSFQSIRKKQFEKTKYLTDHDSDDLKH